jgi:hypothetical protein
VEECVPSITPVEPEGSSLLTVMALVFIIGSAGVMYRRSRQQASQAGSYGSDDVEMSALNIDNSRGPRASEMAQRDFVTGIEGVSSVKQLSSEAQASESEPGSATILLRSILSNLGIHESSMSRYTRALDHAYISTTSQLRSMDSSDWKRIDLPEVIKVEIRQELTRLSQLDHGGSTGSAHRAKGLSLHTSVDAKNDDADTSAAVANSSSKPKRTVHRGKPRSSSRKAKKKKRSHSNADEESHARGPIAIVVEDSSVDAALDDEVDLFGWNNVTDDGADDVAANVAADVLSLASSTDELDVNIDLGDDFGWPELDTVVEDTRAQQNRNESTSPKLTLSGDVRSANILALSSGGDDDDDDDWDDDDLL